MKTWLDLYTLAIEYKPIKLIRLVRASSRTRAIMAMIRKGKAARERYEKIVKRGGG